jgi:hypothetical protein
MAIELQITVTDHSRGAYGYQVRQITSLDASIGQIPLTSSDDGYSSLCYDVEVDGARWTFRVSMNDKRRLDVYAWNFDGVTASSCANYADGFSPSVTVKQAIEMTLR